MTLQLTAPNEVRAAITLPTSKSISNRALLIAALCDNKPTVVGPALCDDTAVMVEALSRQGGTINVGAAGTAMRFLTAYFATREGVTVTLGGVERMRQRPIGIVVAAPIERPHKPILPTPGILSKKSITILTSSFS